MLNLEHVFLVSSASNNVQSDLVGLAVTTVEIYDNPINHPCCGTYTSLGMVSSKLASTLHTTWLYHVIYLLTLKVGDNVTEKCSTDIP